MNYQVVLTREGRKWTAEVPALPGCVTWALSKRHALRLAAEAAEGWLLVEGDAPDMKNVPYVEIATLKIPA
jgi:predicted RNase H-like HicB family nuclease